VFGKKYSRAKFWIVSSILLIVLSYVIQFRKFYYNMGDFDTAAILQFIALVIDIIWTNTLANRIRDYGSNPWISLFALIPFVNVGLALYYGSVKYKKKLVSDSVVDNSDTSLAKAVYNHTKDIATEVKPIIDKEQSATTNKEVKPTINEHEQKHTTSQTPVQNEDIKEVPEQNVELENDDAIYEQVMLEIEEDRKVKSAWARALAESDGDVSRVESLYIQFRVKTIKDDVENIRLKEKARILELQREQKEQNSLVCKEKEKILSEFLNTNHMELSKRISDTKIKANIRGSVYDTYAEYKGGHWIIVDKVLYSDS